MPKIVDRDKQRRALAATVAKLIAEVGLENTTLRKVADAHDCTKGMVQHYFANKEELLMGAWQHVEESCRSRLEQIDNSLMPLDRLLKQLQTNLPTDDELRAEWRVRFAFYTRASQSDSFQEALSCRYQQLLTIVSASVLEAIECGLLSKNTDTDAVSRSLLATLYGLGMGAIISPDQLSPDMQENIVSNAVSGLRNAH